MTNIPVPRVNQNQAPIHCFVALAMFALAAPRSAAQSTPQPQPKTPVSTRRIVVSIPDRKLALLENDRVVKIYDVAVGASVSPTPNGEFQIARRLANPTYYHTGKAIGPGASNPLGPRWIGLNVKGFGIHGTNHPESIGKNASHGCIRLRNRDIADLFARVKVGDRVSFVAERSEETAQLFAPASASTQQVLVAENDTNDPADGDTQADR
jgi:lipoprotein-anchoring transpeptidase ErfK/SrfK